MGVKYIRPQRLKYSCPTLCKDLIYIKRNGGELVKVSNNIHGIWTLPVMDTNTQPDWWITTQGVKKLVRHNVMEFLDRKEKFAYIIDN